METNQNNFYFIGSGRKVSGKYGDFISGSLKYETTIEALKNIVKEKQFEKDEDSGKSRVPFKGMEYGNNQFESKNNITFTLGSGGAEELEPEQHSFGLDDIDKLK